MIGQAQATTPATETRTAPLFYTARFDLTGTAGQRHVQSIKVAADSPVVLEAVCYFADVFAGAFPILPQPEDNPSGDVRIAALYWNAARVFLSRAAGPVEQASRNLKTVLDLLPEIPPAHKAMAVPQASIQDARKALTASSDALDRATTSLSEALRLMAASAKTLANAMAGPAGRGPLEDLIRVHQVEIASVSKLLNQGQNARRSAQSQVVSSMNGLDQIRTVAPKAADVQGPRGEASKALAILTDPQDGLLPMMQQALQRLSGRRLDPTIPDPLLAQLCCHFGFESVRFLIALFDENTGRELQNEFVHNMNALGPPGAREPRRFARPYRLPRGSVLRVEIQELFSLLHPALRQIRDDVKDGLKVKLHVTFHGYRELGT